MFSIGCYVRTSAIFACAFVLCDWVEDLSIDFVHGRLDLKCACPSMVHPSFVLVHMRNKGLWSGLVKGA